MGIKTLLAIALLILFTGSAYSQEKTKQDFKRLKWLAGNWTRTNNKQGQTGEETWKITSSSKLTGKSFTLKGTDTVFIEHTTLQVKANGIFYIVIAPGDPKPTSFKITSLTDNSFVCENPEHDFPKKITYQLKGNHIKATISGDGKSIDFFFIRHLTGK